jgi:hypothetical protein
MKNQLNNKEFMYEEYIINKKSCNKIAKQINSSSGTVHKYLKKFGIIQIKKDKINIEINKLLDKKYGILTPIRLSSPPNNTSDKNARYKKWVECKCDCGNITIKPLSSLNYNSVLSCGCLLHRKGKESPNFMGYEEISGKFFNHIKRTAFGGSNRRKRICKEFDLSIEFLWDLYIKQDKKCALSGLPINFKHEHHSDIGNGDCSLDRVDSLKGYTKDNVQWVHKKVNIMKNKFNQNEFVEICKLISNHCS